MNLIINLLALVFLWRAEGIYYENDINECWKFIFYLVVFFSFILNVFLNV